eukprot:1142410-Pelagomonas_calceolata.AAC.1
MQIICCLSKSLCTHRKCNQLSQFLCRPSHTHTHTPQIQERTKSHGWNVEKDLITLPRNELNSPVVIKRTQVGMLACFEQASSGHMCTPLELFR